MKLAHKSLILTLFLTIAILPLSASAVSWSSEYRLTNLSYFEGFSSIAQTADGRIWVLWETDALGNGDIGYNIYDGSSWTMPDLLVNDTHNDVAPAILQALDGKIWVFWASDRYGNYDIFCKTSIDGGSSWSEETPITTNTKNDNMPSAAQTSDGTIWVVWDREIAFLNADLFYKTYDDSWSSEIPLVTDPSLDKTASITKTIDDMIWVAWCSYRTGDYEIFYKLYDGSSWFGDNRLTISENVDIQPSVVQARDGAIWIFWTSSEPKEAADDDLYYKISLNNGATWSATTPLTTDPDDDFRPAVAQINDKKLWVTWTSDRYGTYDILYKTSSEILIHDVAIVDVTPSPDIVDPGQTVSISVVAENQGEFDETFTVTCYAGSTSIGSSATTLAPEASTTLVFPWDTSNFAVGTYTISAEASVVPDETLINTLDNTFIDGTVKVAGHDVSVINVSPSRTLVAQGYTTKIRVEVKNKGTITETFDVTAYYDSTPIQTINVADLGPDTSTTLTFSWNTSGVPLNDYVISATAEQVPGETQTADNSMTDGMIRVTIPGDVDRDRDVDVDDLMFIARALGTDPRYPLGTDWNYWNPDCDINQDDKVTTIDLYIAGKNYGQAA